MSEEKREDYRNSNGLVDGNIPEGQPCPWDGNCTMQNERCPTAANPKPNDYSCAFARMHSLYTLKERSKEVKTKNKYVYLYVVQVYSGKGYGWEDLTAAEQTPKGRREVKEDLKLYRENQPGTYRLIRRRELNKA